MTLTKADIRRRLQDCLVVFDRVLPEPNLSQDLARAKIVSLMVDASRDEVSERTTS
jgi:hypothetical protein